MIPYGVKESPTVNPLGRSWCYTPPSLPCPLRSPFSSSPFRLHSGVPGSSSFITKHSFFQLNFSWCPPCLSEDFPTFLADSPLRAAESEWNPQLHGRVKKLLFLELWVFLHTYYLTGLSLPLRLDPPLDPAQKGPQQGQKPPPQENQVKHISWKRNACYTGISCKLLPIKRNWVTALEEQDEVTHPALNKQAF